MHVLSHAGTPCYAQELALATRAMAAVVVTSSLVLLLLTFVLCFFLSNSGSVPRLGGKTRP